MSHVARYIVLIVYTCLNCVCVRSSFRFSCARHAEVRIQRSLQHRYILQLIQWFEDSSCSRNVFILSSLCLWLPWNCIVVFSIDCGSFLSAPRSGQKCSIMKYVWGASCRLCCFAWPAVLARPGLRFLDGLGLISCLDLVGLLGSGLRGLLSCSP